MNSKARFIVPTILLPLLISASAFLLFGNWYLPDIGDTVAMAAGIVTEPKAILQKFGVKVERNPSEATLSELGVSSWPKYSGEPSKIPWSFKTQEKMYILEGKATVSCDGLDGSFELGAGNLAEFPKGMNITWHVTEALKKHYHLEEDE